MRQVFEAFPARRRPEFATVQTYLRRLDAKGYLRSRLDGRIKFYSPRVRPRQVIREKIEDFINRLFDGEMLPSVQCLIQDREITRDEIQALREMLDKLEAKGGKARK